MDILNDTNYGTMNDGMSVEEFIKTSNCFDAEEKSLNVRLQLLMNKLSGDDRCTVCEAIRTLEKSQNKGTNGNYWIVLLFLIFFGFNDNSKSFFDEEFLKIMQEVLEKRNSENEEEEMQ